MLVETIKIDSSFETWRTIARRLRANGVPPEQVSWVDGASLFDRESTAMPATAPPQPVPAGFVKLADRVALHRDREKWSCLYRVLWRLTHGERHLLDVTVDPDVHRLIEMEKSVRRDIHKMKAFVRFRKVDDERGEHYIAWHQPDHFIVRAVAPFFCNRFATMRWTILTPDASMSWDQQSLSFGPGLPRSAAPMQDELELCWRTYYASIFNPARIKLKAMQKEMPKKHWRTMPETDLIQQMLRDAPTRVATMVERARTAPPASAAPFVPTTQALRILQAAAASCQGCLLHCNATQTVWGEGPAGATCMVIGEQPGDQEDRAGRPFVGPAGQVLDAALIDAGLVRDQLYLTNSVKHFKFVQRGLRRIHAKPSPREVAACHPWLQAEIAAVQPKMIVCLGVTAAQSLLGMKFRLTDQRGVIHRDTPHAPWVLATIHPSFILRIPDPATQQATRQQFVTDLRLAALELARCKTSAA